MPRLKDGYRHVAPATDLLVFAEADRLMLVAMWNNPLFHVGWNRFTSQFNVLGTTGPRK